MASEPGKTGSWYLTADILNGREYLEQVTNFHYVVTVDPKKGKRGRWIARNHRIPVDFWDCEIYAEAAAEMVVGTLGWDADAWDAWKQSAGTRPDKLERKDTRQRVADYGER